MFHLSKPWIPEPRSEIFWMEQHYWLNNQTRQHAEKIQIVFLGASIVEQWQDQGMNIFEKTYKPLGAYNYGIGGDRTEHLLWRMSKGEMEGIKAKVAIIQIGLNNIFNGDRPSDIAKGSEAIIKLLKEQIPGIQVILVSLIPQFTIGSIDRLVHEVNEHFAKLDDKKSIHWLDLEQYFYLQPGQNKSDLRALYLEDRTHLTEKGYQLWNLHMEPIVKRLLDL